MACHPIARRLAAVSRMSCCRSLLLALVLPLLLTLWASHARSDEAYVCEGGRVVQVRLGDLDRLKRTDPCIAAYYGLAVEAAPAGALYSSSTVAPPLPDRKPVELAATLAVATWSAPPAGAVMATEKQSITPPAPIFSGTVTAPRVERVVFDHQMRRGRPVAASGTADFRNIPIINAAPGGATIFHHTR